ncbi:MAG: phosphopantetheine-binding protein [Pigmentiphaga sp.]
MNEPSSSPPADSALSLERLRTDVAAILHEDPSEILDDDNLIDLGLDSIRAMALVTRWREAGADIEFAELAERAELAHWWRLIERSLARSRSGEAAE